MWVKLLALPNFVHIDIHNWDIEKRIKNGPACALSLLKTSSKPSPTVGVVSKEAKNRPSMKTFAGKPTPTLNILNIDVDVKIIEH